MTDPRTAVVEALREAIEAGEPVTLTYNAGSRPGSPRTVRPVSVTEVELKAIEQDSRISKSYRVNRIAAIAFSSGRVVHNAEASISWKSTATALPALNSLAEFVAHFRSELIGGGWHVYDAPQSCGVAKHFKNGKPRKSCEVSIEGFEAEQGGRAYPMLNLETGMVEEWTPDQPTGHERPWYVSSPRFQQARTYRHLQQAFATFLGEARALAPGATEKPDV